jgi:hypothetical protein
MPWAYTDDINEKNRSLVAFNPLNATKDLQYEMQYERLI